MRYTRVFVDALAYELPPIIVSSEDLEDRLAAMYRSLHIAKGQLEALTGITERRWWPEGYRLSDGAVAAARKALAASGVAGEEIGAVIYGGVCRELFEPATACRVAAEVGVRENAAVFDITNACLGVINGMMEVANRIELGQIRAGLVVSCESAREIVQETIDLMLAEPRMERFTRSLATLTGGSGAIAVVLTDGSFHASSRRRLLGGVHLTAPQFHELCRWGLEPSQGSLRRQFMQTDAVSVLKNGVELGVRTWQAFLQEMGWSATQVDKIISHQVGAANQDAILKAIGVPKEKDFITYEFLGNIGTVSLPITAAIAEDRGFLKPGDNVAFLGIGSGLNCLMLGLSW